MWKTAFLFLVFSGASFSWAESPKEWNEVRSLYDSGKTNDALLLLLKNPSPDPSYFYNVGTMYLKTQRAGLAVPYLEKALRLSPLDRDVRHNLELARTELGRLISSERVDPASTLLDSVGDQLALAPTRAVLALLGLVLLLFSVRIYSKRGSAKEWILSGLGPIGVVILCILSLYSASSLLVPGQPLGSHPAAFPVEHQTLRSGPGDQFLELTQVEAGTKLRLLGSAPGSNGDTGLWYQVRFSEDRIGWIKASSLLIL